ncbi:DUF4398 domain-containing protein [Pseudoxanthomonas helianthi]|uniref:DUF4398 domain-containing protein n=1 Tax=Pseudoxanthomonas helianthi TaxID=1453541 RepID=A0A940X0B2_9GAMM|nr:DUF4398 domain-containing protein [Pseudoxanthomonas helianthi]
MAILLGVTFAGSAVAQVVPEVQAAQQAVDRADQADADQYAPDLLASARQGLAAAQTASQGGRSERRQAAVLAQRAAADADLARARSQEAVARAQLEQRRAEIAELQQRLEQPPSPPPALPSTTLPDTPLSEPLPAAPAGDGT